MKLTWLNKLNVLPLAIILTGAAGSLPVYAQSQQPIQTQFTNEKKINRIA